MGLFSIIGSLADAVLSPITDFGYMMLGGSICGGCGRKLVVDELKLPMKCPYCGVLLVREDKL